MRTLLRSAVRGGSLLLLAQATLGIGLSATGSAGPAGAAPSDHSGVQAVAGCALGNGVRHVVEITFDNVHFFRDNPNVPSDLEMMPHLAQFIEQEGTLLSNNHTPLIAHTADDILTTLTGLYGDRQGMPISNSYQSYNPGGSTDPAGSFAYWTDPVFDTASTPSPGHDTNPSMVYSPTPPATTSPPPAPTRTTPAPWVPFTRAGCNVGAVGTANVELENTAVDIPKVFGSDNPGGTSPEVAQLAADGDSFKDAEVADYVGVAVHCGAANAVCTSAQAVKFGQTSPSPSAVADSLPDEPGGYQGYQGLFGHRYVAPVLGAGTPDVTRNGYAVTNAAGNLVDLNGNQINGAFLNNHPGFPGFGSINASQTLAYMAGLQESGVPVTYGYISDIHGNEHIPGVSACSGAPSALGSGTPCYVAQAQYYDQAFETFFQRLAADGITPANTEFVFSTDEGDHEAGANVGRALQPSPANCDGATVSGTVVTPDVPCAYPAGTFGELNTNLSGLLATEKGDTTPFSLGSDSAPELYVTGNPAPTSPTVRSLEHDVAGLTAANPYSGNPNELITNYLADPAEEAILHMVNADPARTPTVALFAKPDYFLSNSGTSCAGPCVTINPRFAWNHGDYAAEIDTNWLGLVGPGVASLGLDGDGPSAGPNSAGPQSGQTTVPGSQTTGTWVDETDIRPTLMFLTGLRDDYPTDGRVVTEVLDHPAGPVSTPPVTRLAEAYKQLNSSVGDFGTATLALSTTGIESTSPGDGTFQTSEAFLGALEQARDRIAGVVKAELESAAFDHRPVPDAGAQTTVIDGLITVAQQLAAHPPPAGAPLPALPALSVPSAS